MTEDWTSLIKQNEYFAGQALNTPSGNFPYSLRLSEDKKSLSTSRSERGYQSFTLTKDGLSFELNLGSDKYLFEGNLLKNKDSNFTKWIFTGETYGAFTKIIFSLKENSTLIILTYRNNIEHARIEIQASN